MGRVLKIAARPASFIVAALRRRGVDPEPLLKEVGLARGDLADPDNRVPYAAVLGLAERAATATGDAGFGLRLGASIDPRDSGLLGFVLLNSPTLLDALGNLKRYFRVIGEGEDFEIERGGPTVTLRFRETDPALRGLRQNSDYLAAIVLRACRDLVRRRIVPRRASFIHARPNGRVPYDEVLGCPVSFGAPWDALTFDAATMALPVVGADDRLLAALQAACARLLGPARAQRDLVHEVRELMLDGLSRGGATLDAAAGAVGLSPKTLERRLARHGTSFTKLLDTLRADLVRQYLADTDFRLEQVAYLAGYSEPAALVRAFRRWTGTTPAAFRASHHRPAVASGQASVAPGQ